MASTVTFTIRSKTSHLIDVYGQDPDGKDFEHHLPAEGSLKVDWHLTDREVFLTINVAEKKSAKSSELVASKFYTVRSVGDFCWLILAIQHDFDGYLDVLASRPDPVALIRSVE